MSHGKPVTVRGETAGSISKMSAKVLSRRLSARETFWNGFLKLVAAHGECHSLHDHHHNNNSNNINNIHNNTYASNSNNIHNK